MLNVRDLVSMINRLLLGFWVMNGVEGNGMVWKIAGGLKLWVNALSGEDRAFFYAGLMKR